MTVPLAFLYGSDGRRGLRPVGRVGSPRAGAVVVSFFGDLPYGKSERTVRPHEGFRYSGGLRDRWGSLLLLGDEYHIDTGAKRLGVALHRC